MHSLFCEEEACDRPRVQIPVEPNFFFSLFGGFFLSEAKIVASLYPIAIVKLLAVVPNARVWKNSKIFSILFESKILKLLIIYEKLL